MPHSVYVGNGNWRAHVIMEFEMRCKNASRDNAIFIKKIAIC